MFGSAVRNLVRPARRPARGRPVLAIEPLDAAHHAQRQHRSGVRPDRSHRFVSAGLGSINTDQQRAQTFTVGRTGTLSEVDVYVFRFFHNTDHGDLVLDLRAPAGRAADVRPGRRAPHRPPSRPPPCRNRRTASCRST